jgi:uncharacterized membrane protein
MTDLRKLILVLVAMPAIVYTGVIVIMVWGWGLYPRSWLVVVAGYAVVYFIDFYLRDRFVKLLRKVQDDHS